MTLFAEYVTNGNKMTTEWKLVKLSLVTRDTFDGTCCSSDPLMAFGRKGLHDGQGLGECRHCGRLWFLEHGKWMRNESLSCQTPCHMLGSKSCLEQCDSLISHSYPNAN